jgi:hypothetical protein
MPLQAELTRTETKIEEAEEEMQRAKENVQKGERSVAAQSEMQRCHDDQSSAKLANLVSEIEIEEAAVQLSIFHNACSRSYLCTPPCLALYAVFIQRHCVGQFGSLELPGTGSLSLSHFHQPRWWAWGLKYFTEEITSRASSLYAIQRHID